MSEKSLGPSLAQNGHSAATWQLFLQSFMLGAEKMPHKLLWNELNEWRERQSDINSDIKGKFVSHSFNRSLWKAYHNGPGFVLGFDSGTTPLPWEMDILMQKADNRSDRATEAYVVLGRIGVF